MASHSKFNIEMKVGVFVSVGVGLIMLAVIILGGNDSLFNKTNKYHVFLPAVDGLISGARVAVAGITVGIVKEFKMDTSRNLIDVTLQVESQHANLIRKNTQAEVATMGVLGDKFISLTVGAVDQPEIAPNQEIEARPSKDISQFLGKSDQLLVTLNSIAGGIDRMLKTFETGNKTETFFAGLTNSAKNLSLATDKLNQQLDGHHLRGVLSNLHSILEKIDRGNGTLGALINDPALYDDAKSLLGGANRNKIVRNLVRQTIRDNQSKAQDQDKLGNKEE